MIVDRSNTRKWETTHDIMSGIKSQKAITKENKYK